MDLQATRDVQMAVGPITWQEIQAFNDGTRLGLTVWEKRMIRQMDDAQRTIRASAQDGVTHIPINDTEALKSMAYRVAARVAANKEGGG